MNFIRPAGILLATAFLTLSTNLLAGDSKDGSFELIIDDVTAATEGATLILGRIESGTVAVGDTVCVPVYGQDTPISTPVDAINHETMKVESAEKGWRVELFVKGVETDKVKGDGRVTSDC